MNLLPIEKRVAIVGALVEGNSLRSVSRMVGVSVNTAMKFAVDIVEVCEAYRIARIPAACGGRNRSK